MITYIKVPDMNDSYSRIVLNNEEYLIRFSYNAAYDYWTFGIYDPEKNPLLQHRKIVPIAPLNHFDVSEKFPDGIFGCFTKQTKVRRDDFKNAYADFAFIPWKDLEKWREKHGVIR